MDQDRHRLLQCLDSISHWQKQILYGIAVILIGFHAWRVPFASDWDPAYYRIVAEHLLKGEGAVVDHLWSLLYLPELPQPADLYWMPLPSRILLPALLLWKHGDQALNVLIAAALAPLAARAAANREEGWLAGILAASGGMYARHFSASDSVSLYALVGALSFWALEKGNRRILLLLAGLAALTRNDGFLLGLALSLGGGGIGPAIAGVGCYLCWQLRNAAWVPDWWQLRAMLSQVLDLQQLIRGEIPVVSLMDRLKYLGSSAVVGCGLVWTLVLPLPATVLAIRGRAGRAVQIYYLLLPGLGLLLAPAIVAEGSFFRSSSALFVPACVLTARSLLAMGRAQRRYPAAFVAGLLAFVLLSFQWGIGPLRAQLPFRPEDCKALEGAEGPIWTPHPVFVEAFCGRQAVVLPSHLNTEMSDRLRKKYNLNTIFIPQRAPQSFPGGRPEPPAGWTQKGSEVWVFDAE